MLLERIIKEYLSLGTMASESGASTEALECAVQVLRLDPASRAARSLAESCLRRLEHAEPPREARSASCRKRITARILRLHRLVQTERLVRDGIHALPIPGDASKTPNAGDVVPETIRITFFRLKNWLETEHPRVARAIREFLGTTARQMGNPPPVDPDSTANCWSACGLTPEHEIHNWGNDVYRHGLCALACRAYEAALVLDPQLTESLFNLALAHTRLGEYDEAYDRVSRVIELNPALAEAVYVRGLIEEYRTHWEEAEKEYDRALEIDPDFKKAREQRSCVQKKIAGLKEGTASKTSSSRDDGIVRDFSMYRLQADLCLADVGGNRRAKRELAKVVHYLRGSDVLRKWGADAPTGILFEGPSGTGKTYLAKALAGEVGCPYYYVPASAVLSLWYGSTEANMRNLFAEARAQDAAVLFFDEFDGLGSLRGNLSATRDSDCHIRTVNCLLQEMSELNRDGASRVVVLAATNRLENIDSAFLQPGRFNYCIPVGVPGFDDLVEIWALQLSRAEQRAENPELLDTDLHDTVLACCERAADALAGRPEGNADGLVALARMSAEHGLVGSDVREVIRRALDERACAEMEEVRDDLGPIRPTDLHGHLTRYLSERAERHGHWQTAVGGQSRSGRN